jgi:hypothetical protein
MGKRLGELWKALSEEERKVWQVKAAEEKAKLVSGPIWRGAVVPGCRR